ncbi:MAG: hypothetical protein RL469_1470 [Pseudomonadota bacterium]|jgi:predicted methyltransferase
MSRSLPFLLSALTLVVPAAALAQMGPPAPKSDIAQRIEKALASNIRTDDERSRDAKERKPVPTLEFFGLRADSKVIELLPGAGWYTKVLGQVLAEKGDYAIALGAGRLEPKLKEWKLDKTRSIPDKSPLKPSGQMGVFATDAIDLQATDVDLVLTFRNYHNMDAPTRALLNRAVFKALKPGGVYGIVDHTRRHNEPASVETWRRVDPVLVIKEVLDAGFVFEAYSDLHYRPDDDLRFDSQRDSLKGYSDRFTLKFRKPAK